MSTPEDQLREAFQAHESLAPDAAEVYARVQHLSRTYKWRRRGAAAAGGVAVGVGLVAGIANLPAILPGDPKIAPATQRPSPSVAPTLSVAAKQRAITAYSQAGYDVDTARQLAVLWHMSGDIGQIKAEAGRRLLAGQKLPIPPAMDPSEVRREAYFAAGYDYEDAVKLAKLWKMKDPGDAKTEAGKRLLAGEKLPIEP